MDIVSSAASKSALNPETASAIVFTHDRDSEGVIRQCLSDLGIKVAEYRSGSISDAITELAKRSSPSLLIVDVNDAEDPVTSVRELANVCDPDTGVVIFGKANDIRVYRNLKALGVAEYYYKPLVRPLMMQTCHSIITGSKEETTSKTGKIVFVLGARGGCGATTIATVTTWRLAETHRRRVALLDLDLQYGDAALQLDVAPSHALREALEHPERVDELFLDRGVAKVGERLGVMAALEALDDIIVPDESAVLSLLEVLLRRYRYVFVDMPAYSAPHLMHALHLPCTILLVSTGTLVCARDVVRLSETIGETSAERTTIHILNKSDTSECLPERELVRATGASPDIVIPYSRDIAASSRLGIQGLLKCSALQRGLGPLFRQLSGEAFTQRKSLLSRFLR